MSENTIGIDHTTGQWTPAQYAIDAGWSFECVEATAERGVSDEDSDGLTAAQQLALLEFCRERMEGGEQPKIIESIIYYVRWANGTEMTTATLDGARRLVIAAYPDAEFGDLDTEQRGDESVTGRMLAWADVASSVNDAGQRAVAEILRVRQTHRE